MKFLEAKLQTDDFVSIVFIHYAQNEPRRKLAYESFKSLVETTKNVPCELVVVNNGNNDIFPEASLQIINKENLFFAYARNQGIKAAGGKYICVMDNDIIFQDGWIEKCLEILKKVEGKKLLVTPLYAIPCHRRYTYERGGFLVNTMAGSNCWLMHRSDWEAIGEFEQNRISGTYWCQRYSKMGYAVVLASGDQFKGLAKDLGLGKTEYAGYQKRGLINGVEARDVPFYKHLTNGDKIRIC